MDIKIWEGGLQSQEIIAIEKIRAAFTKQGKMFPWKGYAGFRFTNSKGKEGEFDLVIVTHCNVIIVELKDWNHQPVTSVNGRWYKGDRDMGTSPVSVTKNKVFTLQNKLEKYKNKFTNKGRVPFIKYLVVMTGNADFSQLQGVDKEFTISLDDFLKLANTSEFNDKFPISHPMQRTVNKDFDIFDELFLGNQTNARSLNVGGYTAADTIFDHPNGIYKEYYAVTKGQFKNEALLRWWDFSKVSGVKGLTPDGRGQIVSRERNVLQYLKTHNQELWNHCLRSLTPFDQDEVTTTSAELFEFPTNHFRFNEFIGKYASLYSEIDLLEIAKIIMSQFESLHKVTVAHRDINSHSLWLSQSKSVVISNLACAYFKPAGTVGDYREQLAVGAIEAVGTESENPKFNTPFESDVYALAIMLWHLLHKERISEGSLQSLQNNLKNSAAFYASVLYDAIYNKSFKDASEFTTAFHAAEPKRAEIITFDANLIEPYRNSINHSRQFKPDDDIDFFVETDEKEVYCSNGLLVKAWLNTGGINASDLEGFQIHKFIKKIEKLKAINSPYIPRIEDFGIAQKSSSLFLVTEYLADSQSWRQKYQQYADVNCDISNEERLADIGKLISAIDDLHEAHVSHGDLHDENILLDKNSGQIYLIDIPDFNLSGEESRNTQYAPEQYDVDAYQRDNYAVMKLASEILCFNFGEGSENYPILAEAIQNELKDEEFGFKGIARFKQAFDRLGHKSKKIITVYDNRVSESFTIYPENMQMYVGISARTEGHEHIASLTFNGIGGTYSLQYDSSRGNRSIFGGMAPRKKDYLSAKEKENSQASLNVEIQIKASDQRNYTELVNFLNTQTDFIDIVDSALKEHIAKRLQADQKKNETPLFEKNDDFQLLEEDILPDLSIQPIVISSDSPENQRQDIPLKQASKKLDTHKLWTAILDAEIDASPSIELKDTAFVKDNTFICPYDAVKDPLESFDDSDTDKVFAFINKIDHKALKAEGKKIEDIEYNDELAKEFTKEFKLGEVDLKASNLHEVHITKVRNTRYPPEEGSVIYFRSMQSNASLRKRKYAIERILNKQSIISDLAELFDPECKLTANYYDIKVKDEDFDRYNRKDDHGNQISLNLQQKKAFQRLINSGPLSLLQGPPGTGKTEFIAAFVHYLIEKQNVKNILLVSQSHEAVNNAAERIRKHCARLETPLEVVRFSNRENTVSDGLKDVFSKAITAQKRELFLAEMKTRISSLATALGLQSEVMVKVVELELQLFKQIDDLIRLKKISKNINEVENSNTLNKTIDFDLAAQIRELEASIRNQSVNEFNVEISSNTIIDFELKNRIIKALSTRFGLNIQETRSVLALAKVTKEMIDTLSGDYVNYDEFYARSRQLVIGTCVGIGQGHLNIRENTYDWVIIDEAARSQSGELAIAMQSGKRVLLVGDHHQLPPNYSPEQKNVIARKLGISLAYGNYDEIDNLLKSDFDRAFNSSYGQQASESLWTQYRMATPIGNLVSEIFYKGKLESSGRTISQHYEQTADVLRSTVTWVDTSDMGHDAFHSEVKQNRGKIRNKEEAKAIMTILKQIAEDEALINYLNSVRKTDAAIGVICMYAEQKRYLQQLFNQNAWPEGFKDLVNIDTVDSYQGKENRIIIVSITRSDKSNTPGFMIMPNRINVALSRAMDRLIVVGNKNVWTGRNRDLPFGKVVKHMEEKGIDEGYRFVFSKTLKGEMV